LISDSFLSGSKKKKDTNGDVGRLERLNTDSDVTNSLRQFAHDLHHNLLEYMADVRKIVEDTISLIQTSRDSQDRSRQHAVNKKRICSVFLFRSNSPAPKRHMQFPPQSSYGRLVCDKEANLGFPSFKQHIPADGGLYHHRTTIQSFPEIHMESTPDLVYISGIFTEETASPNATDTTGTDAENDGHTERRLEIGKLKLPVFDNVTHLSKDQLLKRTENSNPTNTPEQKLLQRQYILQWIQSVYNLPGQEGGKHGSVLMVDDCVAGYGDFFSRDLLGANIPAKQIHAPNILQRVVVALNALDVQSRCCTLVEYIEGANLLLRDNVSVFFPDVFLGPIYGVLPACAVAFRHGIFRCTAENPALIVFATTLRNCNGTISVDGTKSFIPLSEGIVASIQAMGANDGYSVEHVVEGFPIGLKRSYSTMLFRAFYVRRISTLTGGECHDVERIAN
jgi:hypothetical protein